MYEARIAISLGVAINLEVGLARISLSLELSGSLDLYGPLLAGEARISLWVVSFTIRFGGGKRVVPPLLWDSDDPERSFVKSFLPHSGPSGPSGPKVTTISIGDGLLKEVVRSPSESASESDPVRFVHAQKLVLHIRTAMPATEVRFNGERPTAPIPQPSVNGQKAKLGIRPMGKSTLYSLLEITFGPPNDSVERSRQHVNQYTEISLITKGVPLALWGPLAPPQTSRPQEQVMNDALVGIEIRTKAGPRPWETPALELKVPACARIRISVPPTTVKSTAGLGAFGNKTIANTVSDQDRIRARSGILKVLAKTGRRNIDPEEPVNLMQLSKNADYLFQSSPVMARVRQYPPRDYPQVG